MIGSDERFKKVNTDEIRQVKERTYVNIGQISDTGRAYTELKASEPERKNVPEDDDFEVFKFPPKRNQNFANANRSSQMKVPPHELRRPVNTMPYISAYDIESTERKQPKKAQTSRQQPSGQQLQNNPPKSPQGPRRQPPRQERVSYIRPVVTLPNRRIDLREEKRYGEERYSNQAVKRRNIPTYGEPLQQRYDPRSMPGARMNIREQTPAQRRKTAASKRIDPEMPEITRSAKTAQGYRIKKKNKNAHRVFIARAILFAVIFCVTGGIFLLAFKANLSHREESEVKHVTMLIGATHDEKLETVKLNTDQHFRNGVPYLNMDVISEKFGFTVTGDADELRYVLDVSTGENVRFKTDSAIASVNGVELRLDHPVIDTEGGLLVPLVFFEDYVNGIDVSFEESEDEGYYELSVLRVTKRNLDTGHFEEVSASFTLRKPTPAVSIDETGLSKEILDKTYFYSIGKND